MTFPRKMPGPLTGDAADEARAALDSPRFRYTATDPDNVFAPIPDLDPIFQIVLSATVPEMAPDGTIGQRFMALCVGSILWNMGKPDVYEVLRTTLMRAMDLDESDADAVRWQAVAVHPADIPALNQRSTP